MVARRLRLNRGSQLDLHALWNDLFDYRSSHLWLSWRDLSQNLLRRRLEDRVVTEVEGVIDLLLDF